MPSPSSFTVRVPSDLKTKLEQVAKSVERPRSWVVQRALEQYVETEAWQIEDIKASLREADAGEFATQEEVDAVFAKWGA